MSCSQGTPLGTLIAWPPSINKNTSFEDEEEEGHP